ncbi:MAG: hypothetical protein HYT40_00075 [Candidatus Sungbacteria bacterium]|uniref:Uncharacterized protein n=1 Tax=Candidatus Sungiibacteriota bacterium TaxID=2750080 RepID=A0A931WMS0_9BACT|nr:hypothetical protein [Candidatus Sungbacteria bacterium]
MSDILLAGRISHPDGEWLVGNQLPDGHPGRVRPNDPRRLLFKVWLAGNSAKYARTPERKGWEPPLPAHEGRLEFVQVLTGRFACEKRDGVKVLENGDAVELVSDEYRCWFLPEGSRVASGTTICREMPEVPQELGSGTGYEYFAWVRPAAFLGSIEWYVPKSAEIRYKLTVVLEGELLLHRAGGDTVSLGPLEYAFAKKRRN